MNTISLRQVKATNGVLTAKRNHKDNIIPSSISLGSQHTDDTIPMTPFKMGIFDHPKRRCAPNSGLWPMKSDIQSRPLLSLSYSLKTITSLGSPEKENGLYMSVS